jgi:hypothetical protein
MNLQENIQRIKEVMGISESNIPISIRRRASEAEIERYIKDAEFDLIFYCDHYVDAEDYAYDVIDTAVDNFLSQIEDDIEEKDYYSDVLDYLRNLCRNSFGEYLIDAHKTNCKGKKI